MANLLGNKVLNVYIGFDESEIVAYHTLSHSIIKNASGPVRISPICSAHFKNFFNRVKISYIDIVTFKIFVFVKKFFFYPNCRTIFSKKMIS